MIGIFLRAPYNYDYKEASNECCLECLDESLTVQDSADECDINTIVRKFGITGELPVSVRAPTYGDFTGVYDYQTALEALRLADDSFMQMPADVRARFGNDPHKFVEFCSDEANREELGKMGLLKPSTPSGNPATDSSAKEVEGNAPGGAPAQ